MNRKYIKENKKALREFLGATIAAIVTGALTKGFDSKKELDKHPDLKKSRQELDKVTSDLDKRLEKLKRKDPEAYKRIQSLRLKY